MDQCHITTSVSYILYKVKASSYITQYPILRTFQSALHFTSLTDLFNQTPSQILWEASSHMLQLKREGCSYTYPPLSIVNYSFIQLSELEQCRVKKLAQGFNTLAQDSNPGSRKQESKALPLSHCALLNTCVLYYIISTMNALNMMLYKMNIIINLSTLCCTNCPVSLRSPKMQWFSTGSMWHSPTNTQCNRCNSTT